MLVLQTAVDTDRPCLELASRCSRPCIEELIRTKLTLYCKMFQLYSGMEFQLKLQVYACKRRLKLTENRLLLELFEDDNLQSNLR